MAGVSALSYDFRACFPRLLIGNYPNLRRGIGVHLRTASLDSREKEPFVGGILVSL